MKIKYLNCQLNVKLLFLYTNGCMGYTTSSCGLSTVKPLVGIDSYIDNTNFKSPLHHNFLVFNHVLHSNLNLKIYFEIFKINIISVNNYVKNSELQIIVVYKKKNLYDNEL